MKRIHFAWMAAMALCLLLMPTVAWAFGDNVSAQASIISVDSKSQHVDTFDKVKVTVDLLNDEAKLAKYSVGDLYIWAEDEQGQVTSALNTDDRALKFKNDMAYLVKPDPEKSLEFDFYFMRSGNYTFKAAYTETTDYDENDIKPQTFKDKGLLLQTKGTYVSNIDEDKTADIHFRTTSGPVNRNNSVWMQLHDNGTYEELNTRATVTEAKVLKKPEGAQVSAVIVDTSHLYDTGEAELVVTSDKPGEAVIRVNISGDNTKEYKSDLTYTFKADKEAPKPIRVTMTVGSKNLLIGDRVRTMESAPYVDKNWRTMVPYRALAEAFDAKVDWNSQARTVTTKVDDKVIVMTIGSKTYTVNGKTMQMDTAPMIDQAGRTQVPVRFIAKGLGYQIDVEPSQAKTTGHIIFRK